MIKPVFLILWTFIVPVAIGLIPVRFMERERRTLPMIWISGWVMMTAIFQAVSVPMIINEMQFSFLAMVYTGILTGLGAVSLLTGLLVLKEAFKKIVDDLPDRDHLAVMLPVILLIVIQLIAMVKLAYPDGDDAFYIGTSLTTQYTDSMYIYSPYNGASSPMDLRHALSPVPVFMSWLSNMTGVHVTILCHSYMGCLLLLLMYVVYMELGKILFPEQKRNCWIFLLFVNVLYLCGNISIYTPETFAYTRIWQGKGMFANIVVPLLFLFLVLIVKNEMDTGEWMLLFILSMMAVFTTSTAVFTVPVILVVGALFFGVRKKNIRIPFQMLPCMLPCALYGLLYLILR